MWHYKISSTVVLFSVVAFTLVGCVKYVFDREPEDLVEIPKEVPMTCSPSPNTMVNPADSSWLQINCVTTTEYSDRFAICGETDAGSVYIVISPYPQSGTYSIAPFTVYDYPVGYANMTWRPDSGSWWHSGLEQNVHMRVLSEGIYEVTWCDHVVSSGFGVYTTSVYRGRIRFRC